MDKNIIIIYHGPYCCDGFGSALAAYLKFGDNAYYYPTSHGSDIPPDVTGKIVYILDFSYKKEILEKMINQANCLKVIDHHKTAEKELEDINDQYKIFDMNHSGAILTWKYFFPDLEAPLLLQYVEDRDIWLKQMPNTEEVTTALFDLPKDFEVWKEYLNNQKIEELIEKGSAVLEHNKLEVQKITNSAFITNWNIKIDNEDHDFNVAVCNSPTLQSDIGNYLVANKFKDEVDFAAVFYYDGEYTKFSLRSTNDKQDVSIIARIYGGGGHRNAAGCAIYGLVSELN